MEDFTEFRKALHSMFDTPEGRIVRHGLERMHVDSSALGATQLETAYKLGQKEFVQGLLKDSETDLTNLSIASEGETYE